MNSLTLVLCSLQLLVCTLIVGQTPCASIQKILNKAKENNHYPITFVFMQGCENCTREGPEKERDLPGQPANPVRNSEGGLTV